MNSTLDLLMKRRSVRSYAEKGVAEDEKRAILQAAMRAPTAGNMMLYTILEVADQALKNRLAETCDDQPFIAKAPLVLLFLADYQRWYDYYRCAGVPDLCDQMGLEMRKPSEGDLLLSVCDTLIAAQSAVLAAEALGIGSCYIGDILEEYEIHQQLFDLPPYVLPVTLICFGYPTAEASERALTPRFDAQFIVHKDRYRRLNPAELEEMMRPRNEQMNAAGKRRDGLTNIAQFNYLRKFSAEFSLEMSRSVRKMIETWNRG
jgi:nitroreductase